MSGLFRLQLYSEEADNLSTQSLGLAASSVSDVLITITLVYHLVCLFLFAENDCVLIRAASTQNRLHVYRFARRPHYPTYASFLVQLLLSLLTSLSSNRADRRVCCVNHSITILTVR